jgi:hypothetical protein
MARGDEGESVNPIRTLLAKFLCLRSSSGGEENHGLGDTSTELLGISKRNITPFPTTARSLLLFYAYFAEDLRSIPPKWCSFKLS